MCVFVTFWLTFIFRDAADERKHLTLITQVLIILLKITEINEWNTASTWIQVCTLSVR